MPFGREILLRNVKYALRRVDLFHFTESVSFLFHNLRSKLFHINEVDISLKRNPSFVFFFFIQTSLDFIEVNRSVIPYLAKKHPVSF